MTTRVLVADALASEAFDDLRAAGVVVDVRPELKGGDLPAQIKGYKVLVVRSTKVTEATLGAADALALIVRAGSGVNTIDVAEASARGIFVSNCPGKNAVAVAELAIGLLLAVDRHIPAGVKALHDGRWNKKAFSKAQGVKGRRIGLVGFGAIAKAVAHRALAFEMEVTAYSRSLTEDDADAAGVARATSLEQLFRSCDVVSVHVPATAETKGMVDAGLLGVMKPGAIFLNTSRSAVVDEAALIAAVKDGRIRVGTDVFADEPEAKAGEYHSALGTLEGVVGTHHVGASTTQAQAEIADEAVRIVTAFCTSGDVISPVNLLLDPPTAGTMVVRHLDRVGVLANVLSTLRKANINVQTMQNIVFQGAAAACARIELSDWPDLSVVQEIGASEHVIHIEVV